MKTNNRRQDGFSLIEMVLAIGVIAFAFLSLLALLPAGMSNFRDSNDRSIGTWINQQIVGELQQTDPGSLPSGNNAQVRYFDVDGGEVKTAGGGIPNGTIYQVHARVSTSPTLPGAVNANENLAMVTVQIANNPGNQPLLFDGQNLWMAKPGVSMTTYSTFIATPGGACPAGN
jgi:uncharacterized protein (TIGR02598 family)